MPKPLKYIMIAGAVLLALSLSSLAVLLSVARPRGPGATALPAPEPGFSGLRLADFLLTDQDDRPVSLSAFKSHITIVDFMFTNCPFICPRLTGQMLEMAEALKGTPVRFASFSVDPTRDTPSRLRAYAKEKGIDTTRWSLLTGDQSVVDSVVKGSLHFELSPDSERTITLADGSTMHNITHPGHFVVIGPDGAVLAMRRSSEPGAVEQLVALARTAAAQLR